MILTHIVLTDLLFGATGTSPETPMATFNLPGPINSNPGYVDPYGRHKLESTSSWLPYFVITNSGSDSIGATSAGTLKIEFTAPLGARFGIFLMDSSSGNKNYVGDLLAGSGGNMTNSTVIANFTATVLGDSKANNSYEYREITVDNSIIAAVDGAATMRVKFVPRNFLPIKVTGLELSFSDS